MNQIASLGMGRRLLLSAVLLAAMSPSLSGQVDVAGDGDSYSLATYCPGERSPACQDHDSPKPSSESPRTGEPAAPEPPGPAEPTDPTTPG